METSPLAALSQYDWVHSWRVQSESFLSPSPLGGLESNPNQFKSNRTRNLNLVQIHYSVNAPKDFARCYD